MPELPEAETIRCQLAAAITRRTVESIRLHQPRTWRFHRSPDELRKLVEGRRVLAVGRRGKAPYLLLDGPEPSTLILRLGMTGLVRIVDPRDSTDQRPAAVLALSGRKDLRFFDTRTFGALIARRGHDVDCMPEFAHYGPEPLSDEFTLEYLAGALSRRRARLQDVLMNQGVVAGIGKIYADEICFRAGLRPGRRACGLTGPMRRRLWRAVREVLAEGIECRGSSARDGSYRDVYGMPGRFRDRMHVYQRTGQACRICGATIRRTRIPGGRGLHWCPFCQK
jgi:formamidopyrimidine-DNA glycosylase